MFCTFLDDTHNCFSEDSNITGFLFHSSSRVSLQLVTDELILELLYAMSLCYR